MNESIKKTENLLQFKQFGPCKDQQKKFMFNTFVYYVEKCSEIL